MSDRAGPAARLTVPVRVQARGSCSEIQGVKNGRLRIKTTAAPTGGKANKDVIRQLAAEFGVAPSRITLKSGAARRNKIFVVADPAQRPAWLDEL